MTHNPGRRPSPSRNPGRTGGFTAAKLTGLVLAAVAGLAVAASLPAIAADNQNGGRSAAGSESAAPQERRPVPVLPKQRAPDAGTNSQRPDAKKKGSGRPDYGGCPYRKKRLELIV